MKAATLSQRSGAPLTPVLLGLVYAVAGDLEKASGLPVSPLFDREHAGVSKSQVRTLSYSLQVCTAHS
eukprot:1151426-Pelagomonas_calceolata.AAC.8